MSGAKILIDEDEPVVDVEEPPFEASHVVMRTDMCFPDEFNVIDFLGRGKYGEVKRCVEISTGREFAAKFIATPKPQDRKDVEHEVHIMTKLHHRRLVQLYDAFDAKREMCLVIEIVYGGELFDRVIKEDFLLTERACICFIRQICEGVEYMHSRNIVHLDLKPENIMCLSKTGNRVKIIDFGLAREFDPKKDNRLMHGTPEFMAPEVVLFDPIDFATDMWSIGVMCYVLLSGLSPFMGHTDTDTLCNVSNGKYNFAAREFENVSTAAKNFITQLLQTDKRRRITASECLQSVWLKKPSPPPSPSLQASKARLKHLVCRRKWQKAIHAIIALRRMGADLNSIRSSLNRLPFTNARNYTGQHQMEQNGRRIINPTSSLQSTQPKTPTYDNITTNSSNAMTTSIVNNQVDGSKMDCTSKPVVIVESKQTASGRQISNDEKIQIKTTPGPTSAAPHGWKARLGLTKVSKAPAEVPMLHETSSLCDNPTKHSGSPVTAAELCSSTSTSDTASRKKPSSSPMFSFHLTKSKNDIKVPARAVASNSKVVPLVGDGKGMSNGDIRSSSQLINASTTNPFETKTGFVSIDSTKNTESGEREKRYGPNTENSEFQVLDTSSSTVLVSNKHDIYDRINPDGQTRCNGGNEASTKNGFEEQNGFNGSSASPKGQPTTATVAMASPPARRTLLRDKIKFFNKKL